MVLGTDRRGPEPFCDPQSLDFGSNFEESGGIQAAWLNRSLKYDVLDYLTLPIDSEYFY